MRSLFLRIFLSFWLAQGLFVVLAILVTLVLRPSTNASWDALAHNVLSEAITAHEQGGADAVRALLDDVQVKHEVHIHIFDEHGEEISGRHVPDWMRATAMGHAPPPLQHGLLMPSPQVITDSRSSLDGKHVYTLVMALPPGPRVFWGPHGLPVLGLLISVLSSGLVCYLLAWYVAKPVVRLRQATQQLAAGNLSARTGAPLRRRDELAGLMRDFDAMASRIEGLLKSQSRLLNDISHELRSPLARLNVALGLARQRSGPESAEMLSRIELEAERLNEMIGRLLTLARMEDAGELPSRAEVFLNEIVRQVAADAEFESQARNCRVRCLLPAQEVLVRGEASLLHSAIENVVRNAVRYTREGTQVEVTLEKATGTFPADAIIRVTDEGPGVPQESLGKLFQPFYRLDDARVRQTGGVGLGLAITERAIRLHGGTVTARNRDGGGLIVEILLPLASNYA